MAKKRKASPFIKQLPPPVEVVVENIPLPAGPSRADIRLREQELELLRRQERIYHCLPHLYGFKWYKWAREFFESRNSVVLLVSGNQLSKSSSQIRKCIHWATSPSLWPELWPGKPPPKQMWYMYPSRELATSEFETKWVPEFLPREEYKDNPTYGWKEVYSKEGYISEIVFNSGVTVYFKVYTQKVIHLQGSTVYAIFVDEELPMEMYDELMFRLHATEGYFSSVFTATLGQEFWRCAMEERGKDMETLVDAHKIQVSAYDCLEYEDGSATPWTVQRIEAAKKKCKSQAEIDKRIYGRFVMDEGLKYEGFSPSRHIIKAAPIPGDWSVYAGVDMGSGGRNNHPAAICFLAVAPNRRLGYIFRGWRGDGITTAAGDVFDKYRQLVGAMPVVRRGADPRAVDFHTITARAGHPFEKSESKHDIGEGIISTLFKNDMLFIFEDPELRKLAVELSNLSHEQDKKYAKDDFIDALRYTVTLISWDWEIIADKITEDGKTEPPERQLTDEEELTMRRRGVFKDERRDDWREFYEEIDEWNGANEF